jgi:hypothetical protein
MVELSAFESWRDYQAALKLTVEPAPMEKVFQSMMPFSEFCV